MVNRLQNAIPLPDLLREALERGGLCTVDIWWDELDIDSRRDIIKLWSDCTIQHFGADMEFDSEMDMRVVGTILDPSSDTFEGFWNHEFYSYVVNHEGYFIESKAVVGCTAAASARASIESGIIEKDFVCSRGNSHCPMRKQLSEYGGRSIRLSLTFVPRIPTPSSSSFQRAGC